MYGYTKACDWVICVLQTLLQAAIHKQRSVVVRDVHGVYLFKTLSLTRILGTTSPARLHQPASNQTTDYRCSPVSPKSHTHEPQWTTNQNPS